MSLTGEQSPTFNKDRHIKYYLRCLKTFLPRAYTSSDSNRMTLGYFIIAGLDLLGALNTAVSEQERSGYANWIYHCQVPTGGFRGFPGTDFGEDNRTPQNECWDPANVPATFFALVTLLVLGHDLSRVRRRQCLLWLRKMQRKDGSFGEVLGPNGTIEGDRDLRFCCCASGIRYILRGEDSDSVKDIEDIDVERLISYVKSCQSYDGGFAGTPGYEAHAGLTYCALGTLSFLETSADAITYGGQSLIDPVTRHLDLIGWLACRQTARIYESDDSGQLDQTGEFEPEPSTIAQKNPRDNADIDEKILSLSVLPEASQLPSASLNWAGFNGRPNKIADTCYCFWVTGSLAMLGQLNTVDANAKRNFLLEKTQHMIGGFGKSVDEPPDVLHSYLGLASLGLFGENGVEEVDPTFCTSKRTRQHLESLPWWKDRA